ncbi:MAG: cytochrome b561 domain-containing protein [Pseudomonadota bacterium]
MEWLWAPIDPSRAHDISFAVSWHARSMVIAWAVIAPLAVIAARFFKVMPGQDWPRELDNQIWWRSHWIGQVAVLVFTLVGLLLILGTAVERGLHGTLGYAVLVLLAGQVGLGIFRGTKGGPTARGTDGSLRGDHYDMTPWRVMFEWLHKGLGYTVLVLAAVVIALGLWQANAPIWMWLLIALWYLILICASTVLQLQGRAVDTYQAIWGPDPVHPGNARKPIGWGVRRTTGDTHVRSD